VKYAAAAAAAAQFAPVIPGSQLWRDVRVY
jgi:hypothetical protein